MGDGDILISLKPEHTSTAIYTDRLRRQLNEKFPDVLFFFEAANITNQILNFGLPAPIDVQVTGRDAAPNYKVAQELAQRIAKIPGAADVHVHQVVDAPELRLNVDRSKAGQIGLTQRDVANSLLISLSGSGQVAPNQWLNWQNGVNYQILVQTPQYKIDSVDALHADAGIGSQRRGNVEHAGVDGRAFECHGRIHGRRSQPGFHGLRQPGSLALPDSAAV